MKTFVQQLIEEHDTRNPIQIAKDLGITVSYEPLGKINGYYNQIYGFQFIHINEDLDEDFQLWVAGHELGHALLHEDVNTLFLSANTKIPVSRYENEADQFAILLLVSDEQVLNGYLDNSPMSFELIEYRKSQVSV